MSSPHSCCFWKGYLNGFPNKTRHCLLCNAFARGDNLPHVSNHRVTAMTEQDQRFTILRLAFSNLLARLAAEGTLDLPVYDAEMRLLGGLSRFGETARTDLDLLLTTAADMLSGLERRSDARLQ